MNSSREQENEALLHMKLAEIRREILDKEARLEEVRLELGEIKRREKDLIRDLERLSQPELFN